MIQQNAFRYCKNNLMKMKKYKIRAKRLAGCSVSMRAPTEEARYPTSVLDDPVEADRIIVAKGILKNTDGRSQKHAAHRIAPAHTEINRHQQWQIDQLRPVAELVKDALENERQENRKHHRTAVILVYLDARLRLRPGI